MTEVKKINVIEMPNGKFYREIATFGDLVGLPVDKAREIMEQLGVEFEKIPDVDLGNLSLDNLHIDYTTQINGNRKMENGGLSFFPLGIPRETVLDNTLIITHTSKEEDLRNYAEMIRKEFADVTDEKLLEYDCMGRKQLARARDECLRRKLIKKVNQR